MKTLLFLCLVVSSSSVLGESCHDFKTCGKCVGNTLQCVWCSEEIFKVPRCQSKTDKNKPRCSIPYVDPQSTFTETKNEKFSNKDKSHKNTVQIKPQKAHFKARPGQPQTFNIFYKPAKDYPLDIYFLMDTSDTMKKYMGALIKEASEIYDTLIKYTNNVRFGVGSFIEKPAFPFANPVVHTTYAFKNHLSLSEKVEDFKTTVQEVKTDLESGKKSYGNYDSQEATLDALMQAMVCNEINWVKAWKMIIVLTDAPYHSAGDGKFIGAFKHNDMKCHLKNNVYEPELSTQYDYPSVSQINKIAQEKRISIVFAVENSVTDIYKILSKQILNSNVVTLAKEVKEKSQIVETIVNQYKVLKQDFVISSDVPPFLEIKYDPDCTSKCKVEHNKHFELTATITALKCPEKDFKGTLSIGPELSDKVEINYEVICNCECESKGEVSFKRCNGGNGTLKCGVCDCNKGWYGESCECPGSISDQPTCKAKNNDVECNGRGLCQCGKCVCDDEHHGQFCESEKFNCPKENGHKCNGNGECQVDGTCKCADGYKGLMCECPTSPDDCMGPFNTECNNHGSCVCGKCVCEKNSTTLFYGPFCNQCDECNRCNDLSAFAVCMYKNKNHDLCNKKDSAGASFNRKVQFLNDEKFRSYRTAKTCTKVIGGSKLYFKYIDERKLTKILILEETEPEPKAQIWVAVGSAVGVVLLVGLLTLVAWKILVDIHDKREYRKFAEQAAQDGFDVAENPLYRPPGVNVSNPAYNGGL